MPVRNLHLFDVDYVQRDIVQEKLRTERTSNNGSVRCAVCGKGKKKMADNSDIDMYTCVDCNAGYWSDSDSLECTACPKGFHTAATNSKSWNTC